MSLGPDTRGVGPHAGRRLVRAGAPMERARLALVMMHGRGASAEDMLGLAEHLAVPDVAVLAPEAAGRSWWPDSFLAPLADNEPGLSSALSVVDALTADLAAEGFGAERTVVLGFSQGACLALEHAARAGGAYHGVVGLSGGLVGTGAGAGPPSDALYGRAPKTFDYGGRLDGTPVFIGCHERDPHIPLARVRESGEVLERMGADVTVETYPGAGHGVVAEEITHLRGLLNRS